MSRLRTLVELTKFPIAALATLTAGAGHLARAGAPGAGLALTVAGTLLLAMASAALNELQEHRTDALMERTRNRPIPRGAVTLAQAAALAAALGAAGFLLLLTQGPAPALLGLLALLWYGAVYTPLKRVTAFAVLPGAVIGALPPALGWTAAGGALGDPGLLALAFLFFLWQVPHFWLLTGLHQRGYDQAGLPTLARHFSPAQQCRLIFTWSCATLAAGALLPAFGALRGVPAALLLAAGSLILLARLGALLRPGPALRRAFLDLNGYVLLVLGAVALDALTRR